MMRIESEEIYGSYVESENGRYSLVLRDSDPAQGRGSHRESGNGKFALVSGETVIFVGECERPVKGAVADNGTFALIDTHFRLRTESTLLVYSVEGISLLKHHFTANTLGVGISKSGRYVVAQSANSDSSDSGKLHLIDTEKKEKISSFEPKIGWGIAWSVKELDQRIVVERKNNRRYEYDFSGTLQHPDRYEAERVEDASPEELVMIVREKLESSKESEIPNLIGLLNSAFVRGLNSYHDYRPLAYRLWGEANEALGKVEEAVADFRAALELDSKVGVKKKLQKLERSLAK